MSNAKRLKFAKWWRGWGGAFTFAIGLFALLYLCGVTGLLDAIGDLIDWAQEGSCDMADATGKRPEFCP